jgi:hypothetical protein
MKEKFGSIHVEPYRSGLVMWNDGKFRQDPPDDLKFQIEEKVRNYKIQLYNEYWKSTGAHQDVIEE